MSSFLHSHRGRLTTKLTLQVVRDSKKRARQHSTFDMHTKLVRGVRWQKPENITWPDTFLALDTAGYIAGFTLFVDGGLLLGRGWKRIR